MDNNINNIYKKIAKKNGVSVRQVKKEIQKAINIAYINPNAEAQNITCKNSIPTPDEMILYIAEKLTKK